MLAPSKFGAAAFSRCSSVSLALMSAVLAVGNTQAQTAVKTGADAKVLIYGGSDDAPPYSYRDARGYPQGFNVDLIRALARIGDRRIEVRLGALSDARDQVAAGEMDLIIIAHNAERAGSFGFLDEVWTLRSAILFLPGRESYPEKLVDLSREVVATQVGTFQHSALLNIPLAVRPKVLPARDRAEEISLLRSGAATAIATGNALAALTAFSTLGIDGLHEMTIHATSYRLATARGREAEMAWLGAALERLKRSGEFSRIVEDRLSERTPSKGFEDYLVDSAFAVAALSLVFVLVLVWNHSLRSQVEARTNQLGRAAAEKDELVLSLAEREQKMHVVAEERTHTARALRESEERYRAFLERSSEGIRRWGFKKPWPKGRSIDEQLDHFLKYACVAECNDAMARLYGLSKASEMIGLTYAEVRALRALPPTIEHTRAFIASGCSSIEWESQWVDRNGVSRWSANTAVGIVQDGALVHTWSTQKDITPQKHAEEGLRHALSLVRATLESSADGLVVENIQGEVVDVNQRFAQIWRIPREMLAPETRRMRALADFAMEHLADTTDYLERVSQILARPDDDSYDVLNLKDGRVVERHSQPQRLGGATVGRVWVFRDVTAREHALLAIQEANSLLEIKNAELERFTYTVSHDLKSPLITIRGFLGHLEASVAEGNMERFREDSFRIARAAGRMENLLNDLLELSRIGRVLNPDEDVPMFEAAQEAADLTRGPLQLRNVSLEIEEGMPLVRGDRRRIVEVLQNLIENATKFAGEEKAPTVRIGTRVDSAGDVFYVRDTGIGIDARHRDKVFDLFEKLVPGSEGTGVGLALVKRIVEAHGGRVWVESEGRGHGSTFCFTLPRK